MGFPPCGLPLWGFPPCARTLTPGAKRRARKIMLASIDFVIRSIVLSRYVDPTILGDTGLKRGLKEGLTTKKILLTL
jgi:hypothetical protein